MGYPLQHLLGPLQALQAAAVKGKSCHVCCCQAVCISIKLCDGLWMLLLNNDSLGSTCSEESLGQLIRMTLSAIKLDFLLYRSDNLSIFRVATAILVVQIKFA